MKPVAQDFLGTEPAAFLFSAASKEVMENRPREVALNYLSLAGFTLGGVLAIEAVLPPITGTEPGIALGPVGYIAATAYAVASLGYMMWRGWTHSDLPPFRPPFQKRTKSLGNGPDGENGGRELDQLSYSSR